MDVDVEILRSKARLHYSIAAIYHREAGVLADVTAPRALMLSQQSQHHRELAREALRLLGRLSAPLGAELQDLVRVHDLSFTPELTTQKETAHEQGR